MLNAEDYLHSLDLIKQQYGAKTSKAGTSHNITSDPLDSNIREFASANLHYLLPEIPFHAHAAIIRDIQLHQAVASLDEESFFLLDRTSVNDPYSMLTRAKDRPVIFCTFHFGSYKLINVFLVSRNLNYILPVEDHIYDTQTAGYLEHFQKCKTHFNSRAQFLVVNAEEPTAALSMARKARAGWSLLAYLDGNTGVQGASRRDAKLLKVPLLGRPIYARKGIAFLSHFLKLPIVPVFCEITGPMERRLSFHDPIEPPDSAGDRDAYCQAATEKLYALLGNYLKKSPSQWLGWLDMHKYLDLEASTPLESSDIQDQTPGSEQEVVVAQKLVFNYERFGFIVREGERVLLDKLTYEFLSVPESVYAVLDACREPVAVTSYMPRGHKETIEQLLSLGLLSPVP